MSTATTAALLTADEFLRLHGGETCVELVRGHVVRCSVRGATHGYVCNNATAMLHHFAREHGLGQVFSNDTFTRTRLKETADSVRGPDVAFVSYARMPKGPIPDGPLPCAPDLVVEVRSPSDRIPHLSAKASEYLDAGVTVVLVLDPETESLAVFRENEFPVRMHNGDELALPDVFPGFAVAVKAFFE
ncbi:Uma2 family endonuclease [Gemmata sp.]|uniref:Uma2 family endonuclease n=1 Tax=Gemmata sp. TaxID=1914242 RepID=UPI003F72D847